MDSKALFLLRFNVSITAVVHSFIIAYVEWLNPLSQLSFLEKFEWLLLQFLLYMKWAYALQSYRNVVILRCNI